MTRPMQSLVSSFIGGHRAPRVDKGKLDSVKRGDRTNARLAWWVALQYGRGLRLQASLDLDWRKIVAREELLSSLRRRYMTGLKALVVQDAQWATVVGLCGKGCAIRMKAKRRARLEREAGLHGDESGGFPPNTSSEG